MDDDKLTLKEEIEIEACLFECGCHNSSVQHHFLEGAECMRKLLIEKACDAYCKVCGHFAHTVPTHICRQDCRYYDDFKQAMEE